MDSIPFQVLSHKEKLRLYAKISGSYINMEAVFSDETESYVTPLEAVPGEAVTIKLRCQKDNIDAAYIYVICGRETQKYEMEKKYTEGFFDFYTVSIKPRAKIKYYFALTRNGQTYYYNKRGVYRDLDNNYNFTLIPGFETPDWAKGAVMYQIYIDRFCNGDTSNDVEDREYIYLGKAAGNVTDWNQPVAKEDVCNFYGGDLQGVLDKMEYLKDLGVEVIYFNPIFVSPSNHKYDIQDYDYVDPHLTVIVNDGGEALCFERFHNKFATKYIRRTTDKENLEGSNRFFAEFIGAAHKNGIRVIIDGVFNHCGAFHKWLDKEGFYYASGYSPGAYRSKDSRYHNYFRWYDENWPGNDCYDSWWGFENHPKLHFEKAAELYRYIMDIGRKWVSPPYNADGWRLDVAADLGYSREFNHRFWRDFRSAVKEANPEAIILAEHYGDASDWLQGDQWDTVMNYDAFMEPITWFLTGMNKHSEEFKADMLCNTGAFEGSMRYFMARFSIQSLLTAMNQLSNHDHSRFLTRTNMTAGRLHTVGSEGASKGIHMGIMREGIIFQMTWPGAPSLYYGDEAGLCGWTDPDNRRPYPWGRENKKLLRFYKEMIAMHKRYTALKTGSLEYLMTDYGVISYGRFDKENKIAVIINNNNTERRLRIPVWRMETGFEGVMERLILSDADDYYEKKALYHIQNGIIELTMPAYGGMVLRLA